MPVIRDKVSLRVSFGDLFLKIIIVLFLSFLMSLMGKVLPFFDDFFLLLDFRRCYFWRSLISKTLIFPSVCTFQEQSPLIR